MSYSPKHSSTARWVGQKGPNGRNVLWTCDKLPGRTIRHCGHPTALYPYYILELPALGTFSLLSDAQAAAAAGARPAGSRGRLPR
jgi:hypothetical protein